MWGRKSAAGASNLLKFSSVQKIALLVRLFVIRPYLLFFIFLKKAQYVFAKFLWKKKTVGRDK